MTGIRCFVFLVVLTFLWTPSSGDTEVSCVFMERCILPCSFKVGPEVVIHWTKTAGIVHLYYNNQDQLGDQHQIYRNRTSLFQDQISRGNASLQLKEVKVQDEGRYDCYFSTLIGNNRLFINLKINAPIHEVNIQQVENKITCSSEGIYPQPELTWSTTPPSNINLHNTTTVQQNEQQLYSISSSLILSDNDTDLVYSCTVKTRRNKRTAALRNQTMNSSETTIPCTTSNSNLSGFSLIWRFKLDQMILNKSSSETNHTITTEWEQYVKNVSESGEITLQDLPPHYLRGIYSCQLSNAEETYVTSTILRIKKYESDLKSQRDGSVTGKVRWVVPIVVLALLVGLIGFCIYKKKKDKKNESAGGNENDNPIELEPLRDERRQEDEAAPVPAAQPS